MFESCYVLRPYLRLFQDLKLGKEMTAFPCDFAVIYNATKDFSSKTKTPDHGFGVFIDIDSVCL